jgi:hypothetical protein
LGRTTGAVAVKLGGSWGLAGEEVGDVEGCGGADGGRCDEEGEEGETKVGHCEEVPLRGRRPIRVSGEAIYEGRKTTEDSGKRVGGGQLRSRTGLDGWVAITVELS